MNVIRLGFVLVIFQTINCQQNRPPLAGHDYILRSCISTAELIRTHRKAATDEKMISTNSVAESSGMRESFLPLKGIMNLTGRGKRRKIEETPLKTLNIRKANKHQSSLPFARKRAFPESFPTVRTRQQKRQRESEIIIIKAKD